ncbi:TPA: single-stranded DNA-binding protein [Candidatus Galligastranaerophilus faecipullorum]|nr:single-stranded DNA-binding protein [Candidatus Galligastranaerophilus faecipullorum]
MTLAKVFITGKVVKNPEKRFTQNDLPITSFTIDANPQDETLVRVFIVGNSAETVEQTVKMGDSVLVEGRLQTNTVKTTSGKDKKIFEINASTVEKISGTSAQSPQSTAAKESNLVQFSTEEMSEDLIDEDEIPF